jgi:hypothetical protein
MNTVLSTLRLLGSLPWIQLPSMIMETGITRFDLPGYSRDLEWVPGWDEMFPHALDASRAE